MLKTRLEEYRVKVALMPLEYNLARWVGGDPEGPPGRSLP